MTYKEHVATANDSLKDFQKATVNYVIGRMKQGQKKFLVADEVGLGKTIVSRGIIANLYEKEYSSKKDFRVIYICSNQALARQNLEKLNFIKEHSETVIDYNDQDDRLTSLAYEPNVQINPFRLKIKALTPATSFDNRRKAGKADERVMLYRLLMHEPKLSTRKISLKWFLRGGQQVSENNWQFKIEEATRFENNRPTEGYVRSIRKQVYKKFATDIKKTILSPEKQIKIFGNVIKGRTILNSLLEILEENKLDRSFENGKDKLFKPYYGLISELRLRLSYVCKDYLKADLFILDEFQKFSQLIKTETADNQGEDIARAIFSDANARVLLLSATPFKAYTNAFDEYQGENHYKEFLTVLKFLQQHKDVSFWDDLEKTNIRFFEGIKALGSKKQDFLELVKIKDQLQNVYRESISRTERALVENSDLGINENGVRFLVVQPDDINDFIAIDEIIQESNKSDNEKLSHPVEYVKSAPFPLSFLQDYDHHKVLKRSITENAQLQKLVKKSKKAFIPVESVNAYKALLPERSVNDPNPKLRLLYDETVRNHGYKLLWIPPCLKYYQPKGGAYANAENFSKTLIFSAWKMVPRMISALVSYEAERLSVGKFFDQEETKSKYSYKDKVRNPRPRLTFKRLENGPSGMNNMMLAYPSPFLASLYNPAENLVAKKDLSRLRAELKSKIINSLKEAGIMNMGKPLANTQKWDWLAVLLLDKFWDRKAQLKTWCQGVSVAILFDGENETDNQESDTHFSAKHFHFSEIRNYLLTGNLPEVGKLNKPQLDKVAEHLADLCLGAPGICALRSMLQLYPKASFDEQIASAMGIGMGMISMFNKPESIAIVDVSGDESFYYKNVLSYAIEGNIQAMLDEFLYQLQDSGGISECRKAADLVKNILMVGSSKVDVITDVSIKDDKHFAMRTHYAVPFGTGGVSDLKNGQRQIKVREAFNSPFRPFVLTSTSIGQEGLDFHFYCKKIIHWNLPNNPIDLEQREGRIKRFKSHVVRKNVADLYQEHLNSYDLNGIVWDALFKYAAKEKKDGITPCDLIPFWHLPKGQSKIDSLKPLYKFSKDISRFRYIRGVLTNYRLTFGQPNQQDLIEALEGISEEQRGKLKELLINLCPLKF